MVDYVPGMGNWVAIMGAFFAVFFVIMIGIYVYVSLALMTIAKKTNTKNPWLAWIPIGNLYLMTQIGKVPWWTMFAFVLGFIPFVGGLAFMAVMIWWWWKIAEARKKPGWYALLMLIPIVNFVIMGILAWGK